LFGGISSAGTGYPECLSPTTESNTQNYDEDKNEKAMRLQLDLVDEVGVIAEQRLARYQNLMAKHYNSNVRHREF